MKCPKCGYNSFEYLGSCKKCNHDLDGFKASHGIRAVVLPFCRPERIAAPPASNEPGFYSNTHAGSTDEERLNRQDSAQSAQSSAAAGGTLEMQDAADEPFSFDLDFSAVEPEKPAEKSLKDFSLEDISGGDFLEDASEGMNQTSAQPADNSPALETDSSFDTFSFDDLDGGNEGQVVAQDASYAAVESSSDLLEEADAEAAPSTDPSAFSFDGFDEAEPLADTRTSTEEASIEPPDPFADGVEEEALSNPFATNEENAFEEPAELTFEEEGAASATATEVGRFEETDPFAFSDNAFEAPTAEPTEEEPADTLGLSKGEYESLFGKPVEKKTSDFSSSTLDEPEPASLSAAAAEETDDPFALGESAFEGNIQKEITADETADTLGLSDEEYEALFGERPTKKKTA